MVVQISNQPCTTSVTAIQGIGALLTQVAPKPATLYPTLHGYRVAHTIQALQRATSSCIRSYQSTPRATETAPEAHIKKLIAQNIGTKQGSGSQGVFSQVESGVSQVLSKEMPKGQAFH